MLVPARWLLILLLLALLLSLVGGLAAVALVDGEARWYWGEISAHLLFSALLMAGLAALSSAYVVRVGDLFGPVPSLREVGRAAFTAVPLVFLSIGTVFLVYLPLSYVTPAFVTEWLLDDVPMLLEVGDRYPLVANGVWLVLGVALAPVVEEIFFRGFLFRRLERKWGFRAGAILSALCFALPHVDVLGATCFGVAMAIVYKESGTLWVPIAIHATNNLVVWIWGGAQQLLVGQPETLASFRADWPWGLVGLAVGGSWFVRLVLRRWPSGRGRLAVGSTRSERSAQISPPPSP